ncbi:hypothetical protein MKW94_014782 [Papaver nudicaule]|uniref:J domain-containing protein n=1 Tax=Papaver nudicaule TaxID=74823 RepID=A0AA41RQP7_PAPNU|nr:hypothetical protein [Papaver nudicaule]
MEAAIRSDALILMKHNDYMGARKTLLDARKSYPELEYIDELIKVCDIVCTAESQSQASEIDWYAVLQTSKTANESDIESRYKELIRTLEPIKYKFLEVQSALGILEKAYGVLSNNEKCYEFDWRRAAGLPTCPSVNKLDIAHSETVNRNGGAASQSSSGTKRNVSERSDESNKIYNSPQQPLKKIRNLGGEPLAINLKAASLNLSGIRRIDSEGSDRNNLICNSQKQPLKRARSLGGEDCEVIDETHSPNKFIGDVYVRKGNLETAKRKSGLNEVEDSLGRSSGSPVKAMVHKEACPHFSNLSYQRMADVFAVGQFLAFYDQEEMPRLYARIDRIESCYKKETNTMGNTLYCRWLRPAPINRDEKKWHKAGLPVSCGFFKLHTDRIDTRKIGSFPFFSHQVSSFRECDYSKGLFELYPREGEVWALYKERKPFHWCSNPRTRKGCKFHLVQILSDYTAEAGVKVAILVKVAEYETIFRSSSLSCQIAGRHMFGFSHNIQVRYAGNMGGLFSGVVFDLDPFSIPDAVVVDTVEAEFGNCSESDGISLGGYMVSESECENSSSYSDDAVNKFDIGKIIESIKINLNKESKWQSEDDMLSSLEEDPVLCMQAVCALHRQQISLEKLVTGSLHNSYRQFSCLHKFEPVLRCVFISSPLFYKFFNTQN